MKRLWKHISTMLILFCMVAITLSGCGMIKSEQEDFAPLLQNEEQMQEYARSYLESLLTLEDEQIETLDQSGQEAELQAIKDWQELKESSGKFVSVGTVEATMDQKQGIIKFVADTKYEKAAGTIEFTVDSTGKLVSMNFVIDLPISALLMQGGVYTVIGIIVLILIIIGVVVYIIQNQKDSNKNITAQDFSVNENKIDLEIDQEPVELSALSIDREDEELVDDLELVAVITAAIAASEQVSTDEFIVRSIRKSRQSRG